jgi:MFS family permease
MNISESIRRFFPANMNQQMREFYVSSAIFDFGAAMAAIFEPVYLWKIGWSLQSIILFFLAAYAFYFLVAPLGASFARSRGYEHSIALSTPFLVLYFLALYSIPRHLIFAVLAAMSFGLFRMFYWPGARSIVARYSADGESGRTLSALNAVSVATMVLGPVIGGIFVQQYGFAVLFLIVSAIILLSNVPMLITPEKFEPHALAYVDAYKRMLRRPFRKTVIAHFGYGEEFISDILWPIFIILLIPSYIGLGAVATAGGAIAIVAIIVIGRMTDEHHRHPIMHAGVLMTSLSWLMRIVIISPLGIVLAQSLYRVSRLTIQVPFMSIAGLKARDYSVMKSSLLYEMSIVVGKIITAAAALALLVFFPNNWTAIFLLAATLTFLYGIF